MAAETTTTSFNDTFATVVGAFILEEARPQMPSLALNDVQALPSGITFQWPILDDEGPAIALTEGTDASNNELTTGAATATATEQGLMATVTDRLQSASLADAMQAAAATLGRSVGERIEDLFCALYDDFSNVTGTTTADLTVAQFLAAISALEQRDAPGPYVAVLHPVQVGDLRTGIQATSNQHYAANPNSSVDEPMEGGKPAPATSLFGVPIYTTNSVVTANAGADRAGAIFSKGQAIGAAYQWLPRTELQRDASLRATEIVATACIGTVELRDAFGQSIVTDA
jgi:hypothetical protein